MALLNGECGTRHLFDLPPLHRKVYQVGYSILGSVFAGQNECFLQWYIPVSFFHKDPTVIRYNRHSMLNESLNETLKPCGFHPRMFSNIQRFLLVLLIACRPDIQLPGLKLPQYYKLSFKQITTNRKDRKRGQKLSRPSFMFAGMGLISVKEKRIKNEASNVNLTWSMNNTYLYPFCGYFNCFVLFIAFFNHNLQVALPLWRFICDTHALQLVESIYDESDGNLKKKKVNLRCVVRPLLNM